MKSQKISFYKAPQSKIMMWVGCFIILIFAMNFVSSAEWDNKLTYSNNDLKVELVNWFGLGKDYGSAELKSHDSVNEVKKVQVGNEIPVMWYEFNFTEEYLDGIGNPKFIDLRTKEIVERNYYFAKQVEVDVNDTNRIIHYKTLGNGTQVEDWIEYEVVGSHKESKWEKISDLDIKSGESVIALIVEVRNGDYIDGVWTIGGKEVSKHAVWTPDLNVGLVDYYKLDVLNSTLNGTYNNISKSWDMIIQNSTAINPRLVTGKINSGINYSTSNGCGGTITDYGYINNSNNYNSTWSWAFWAKFESTSAANNYWSIQTISAGGGADRFAGFLNASGAPNLEFRQANNTVVTFTSNTTLSSGTWYFFFVTFNDRVVRLKVNDVLVSANTIPGAVDYSAVFDNFPRYNCHDSMAFDELGIWNVTLNDSVGTQLYNGGTGISYTQTIDLSSISPVNAANFTTNTINFSGNVSDPSSVGVKNVSLAINGTINQTNASFLTGFYNFTATIPDGFWNWTLIAYDNSSQLVSSSNGTLNFSVDTAFPQVSSNGTTIHTFQQKDTNLRKYWTITDANLQSCFVQWYNGTNASITCGDGSFNVNTTGFYTPRNLTFWANDTFGHYNSSFINWTYKLFLENETYAPHVLEGSTNNFTIQALTNGTTITLANLSYNNEQNIGALGTLANYTIYDTVAAPLVTSDTNYTFFWNLTFGDGTYYAIPSHQQNVSNLGIGNCSYFTNVIYNFTLKDEESQAELNESALSNIGGFVDLDLYVFGTDDVVANFSQTYNQTNPFAVCTNTTFSSGQNYNIDTQVQYFATGYSTELYHIQNATLNSTNLNQNITLYDLLTASTQIFEIIFKDSSFLPVEDALIQIDRKYISEGIFKIVEIPKTDENGETVGHLQLNNVIYNFIIKKYGVTLATFSNVIPVCQTPSVSDCIIDFNAFSTEVDIPDYAQGTDLNFTLGYNSSTRVVSSVFVIPSGSLATLSLNVTREDALGTSVCANIVTSTSGTLSCTVPTSFGNSTIVAKLYRNGDLVSTGQIKLDQDSGDIYGGVLVALSLLIMITLIGAGISDNGMTTLISLLLGSILIFGLNLVVNNGFIGATATILYLILAIIIVMVKGGKRG